MASTGTRGPKPWTQHRASTIFLRVPTADWIAVRHGNKREFRSESGKVTFRCRTLEQTGAHARDNAP